ncbi:3465_t:CDS:2 [Scutellospora calospora]|uniref:3465_t:CDS:1 n=1 Tax=Scutellospora calospora TaxID=85575 RepID=A0ACA9K072_9GLOM|nr:3465_t:CDS:2 [Scutellospora calospora]
MNENQIIDLNNTANHLIEGMESLTEQNEENQIIYDTQKGILKPDEPEEGSHKSEEGLLESEVNFAETQTCYTNVVFAIITPAQHEGLYQVDSVFSDTLNIINVLLESKVRQKSHKLPKASKDAEALGYTSSPVTGYIDDPKLKHMQYCN